MSIFAHPTAPLAAKTVNARVVALAFGFVLIILAVTQLFSFDGFLQALTAYRLGSASAAYWLGAVLVGAELLALPYVLNVRLSRAFRWVSWALGWLVVLTWLWLSGAAVAADVSNVGFLGSLVALVPGWWAVFISIALVVMAVWISWGMWPGRVTQTRTTRKK